MRPALTTHPPAHAPPHRARSILINAGCQLVIFLYLLDSETSMVVLFSAGVGTAIEFWKVCVWGGGGGWGGGGAAAPPRWPAAGS